MKQAKVRVTYSHTPRVEYFDSEEAALEALEVEFPDNYHERFEDRWLVWNDEAESENDDGARALASVYFNRDR